MQITITIPDELAARVQSRGHAIDTYVQQSVEDKLSHEPADQVRRDEAVDAMQRFASKHKLTFGGADVKSTIHEGHKY